MFVFCLFVVCFVFCLVLLFVLFVVTSLFCLLDLLYLYLFWFIAIASTL